MAKYKQRKKPPTHLDEIMEWQEHQYTTWHYLFRLHPFYRARGNKKLFAIFLWIYGGLILLFAVIGGSLPFVLFAASILGIAGHYTKKIKAKGKENRAKGKNRHK